MKRITLLLLLISQTVLGQTSDFSRTVASIDEYAISSAELKYAFSKNRKEEERVSLDSLKAYLEVYINFKLKVLDAYKRGLDQSATFQQELNGYLSQIKKPYLEGFDKKKELIEEAYERMQWQVNASHILIKVDPKASPSDTLKAFQTLDSLRQSISTKGQFEKAAKAYSQDGSAKNGGSLGWFTVFSMVYPFESAAYDTPKGEVSEVVKSQFGYHILYVNAKRKAIGKVQTSHIFFSNRLRSDADCERLAKSMADSLKAGSEWKQLVENYSDDRQTKMKGGALPFAGLRQLPDDYLTAAYALEIGQISQPIKTEYGWHIIRLDQIQPIPEFEKVQSQIEEQVQRSGRNQLSNEAVINKLKKDYNYIESPDVNSILKNSAEEAELFSIREKSFRFKEYQGFLSANPKGTFRQFAEKELLNYADSIAPYDYPTYGFLLKEYEEGLLLFEIMQAEVWNKAVEDTLGQVAYYEQNLTNYAAPIRYDLYEISPMNDKEDTVLESFKALSKEKLMEIMREGTTEELKIVKRRREASELSSFEGFNSDIGSVFRKDNLLIVIEKEIPAGYFDIDEIRGKVISDYQEALDLLFIDRLRAQSRIKKNKTSLRKLLNELD